MHRPEAGGDGPGQAKSGSGALFSGLPLGPGSAAVLAASLALSGATGEGGREHEGVGWSNKQERGRGGGEEGVGERAWIWGASRKGWSANAAHIKLIVLY